MKSASDSYLVSTAMMGTVISIRVVGHGVTTSQRDDRKQAADRALAWFAEVERVCSRFDPASELRRLTLHPGEPVRVSELLFEAVHFALGVAEQSDGAFDPTVGGAMAARGVEHDYRTGREVSAPVPFDATVSYRDVSVDRSDHTITLHRPLQLDLGGVAKGLAVDLAAKTLRPFCDFLIDAGGDVYAGGCNDARKEWSVGIRHPRVRDAILETVNVRDLAVCTSGDYERGQHVLDPRTHEAAQGVASVSIVAPSAMVADALGTAAFVLGPEKGLEFLAQADVEGLIVRTDLSRVHTSGWQGA